MAVRRINVARSGFENSFHTAWAISGFSRAGGDVRFAPETRWGGWLPLPASRCQNVVVVSNHEQEEPSAREPKNGPQSSNTTACPATTPSCLKFLNIWIGDERLKVRLKRSGHTITLSAFGGKADITDCPNNVCLWPVGNIPYFAMTNGAPAQMRMGRNRSGGPIDASITGYQGSFWSAPARPVSGRRNRHRTAARQFRPVVTP